MPSGKGDGDVAARQRRELLSLNALHLSALVGLHPAVEIAKFK